LASRAGLRQPALADIERGAHDTRAGQLDRLVNAAGYRLAVLPTSARSAADWGDMIYQELRSLRRSEAVAFRALVGLSDDLAGQSHPLCVAPPAPSGDRRFDAGIAGVVEHHLSMASLPVPDWVLEPQRTLEEPLIVSAHADFATVPKAFRRHGVLLAESELASV
jgi:hypothetical protein